MIWVNNVYACFKIFSIFTSRTSNAKSWDCTLSSSNFACFGVFTSKAFLFKKKCSLYYHFIIRYIVCLFHKDQARNWLLLPSTMFFSLANTLVLQNFIQRLISLLVWGIFTFQTCGIDYVTYDWYGVVFADQCFSVIKVVPSKNSNSLA